MKITNIEIMKVFIPYNSPVGPYVGRTGPTNGAGSLIVKVETDEGIVGWGETVGGFSKDPNLFLKGEHPADIERAISLMKKSGIGAGARAGVEMALWDIVGKMAGLPICRLLGGIYRQEVELCACMGLMLPEKSAETAQMYVEKWGFTTIKTKAGRDPKEDLEIAKAIKRAIEDRAALRPDANSGYSPQVAEPLLRAVNEIGVQYFEDPCPYENLKEMSKMRQEFGIPLAINMGIGEPFTVLPVASTKAAEVVMPDTPSAGGILPVKQVAAAADAVNLKCVMHCSHDIGIKTAAVAQIAACTPNFSLANDTTYHGLVDDILTEPFVIKNGKIRVPMKPGLGVEVDEEKLKLFGSWPV